MIVKSLYTDILRYSGLFSLLIIPNIIFVQMMNLKSYKRDLLTFFLFSMIKTFTVFIFYHNQYLIAYHYRYHNDYNINYRCYFFHLFKMKLKMLGNYCFILYIQSFLYFLPSIYNSRLLKYSFYRSSKISK